MTDRLQKLLQQRALIQEHLAWLDREIADANGTVPPLPNTIKMAQATILAHQPPSVIPPTSPAAAPAPSDKADEILRQYNTDAKTVTTDARRGCLVMFFVAFAIFIFAVAVGYYFYGRNLGRWW